jgi:DNA replication protein DnaC
LRLNTIDRWQGDAGARSPHGPAVVAPPPTKRLSEFNAGIARRSPSDLAHLATGAYMTAGEPVALLGDSGTGTSHLLIGLGVAACEQGRSVRYTTAHLVNDFVEAADNVRQLSRVVGGYGRLDLLCLDELGFVQIDPRGAEPLFQINTKREELASMATATDVPLSEWGAVFPDARLVAAIVDRVTSTHTSSKPAPSPTGCAPARPSPNSKRTS